MKSIVIIIWFLVLVQSIDSFGQGTGKNILLDQKLDSIFSSFKKNTPGFAITVIEKGKVLARKSYGMASIELQVPFSPNTLVRLGYSEGREFISIASTLMEKEGLLHFRDKVRKYFPDLPAWSEPVTIQDLLNHSSGFADEWNMLALMHNSMANRFETPQFLKLLYNQPLPEIEPGKGYMYSNSDFGLLRLIMEKASGKDLSVYIKTKIFDPLGMTASLLHNDKEDVIANRAFSYRTSEDGKYKLWLRDKTSPGGNYAVMTSAKDLEKWAAAHADSNSFISKAVKRLIQNARLIPVLAGVNYVFGHKLQQIGSYTAIMHMGVGNHCYLIQVPSKQLSIICVMNKFEPYLQQIMPLLNFLLGTNDKISPGAEKRMPEKFFKPKENPSRYAGVYKWQVPLTFQSEVPRRRFSEFFVRNDSLLWLYSTTDTVYMMPVGAGMFKDEGYPLWISFKQPHPDSVMKASIFNAPTKETINLTKITSPKNILEKQQLLKLAGKYYSKHLDYYLTILINEDGKLVVKRPTLPDKILEPGYESDFMLETEFHQDDRSPAWVKFFFDDVGNVSHFTVSSPRMMGHRFDKER